MRRPPRVAHVSLHGCIRAHKQAWALCGAGIETHFLASRISPTHSSSPYATVQLWNSHLPDGGWDERQLKNAVHLIDQYVDLFHVHNEPNWMFRVVRESTDKPVLFDIHDWTTIRNDPAQKKEWDEEEYALANASGFVVPSQGYLKKIQEKSKRPSILIYSKVSQLFYPPITAKKRPGVVFEGGLAGKDQYFNYNYPYRNWASFAQEAVKTFENGSKFYFYAANYDEDFSEYQSPKIEVLPPQDYPDLIRMMSEHSVGLVGTPYPLPDFEDSIPNKLFEYVAAGIPALILNSPEALEYATYHQLGVGISSPTEVNDAMKETSKLRADRDRWKHSIESEIPALVEFYREVLSTNRRVIAQGVA